MQNKTPILFLYYEESVCPLILKYNGVYSVSSLITKPNAHSYVTKSDQEIQIHVVHITYPGQ